MSGKYFDKQLRVGSFDIYVEGALTHHVIGLGSIEWGAGKAKTYVRNTGGPYTAPGYLNIDANLPFSWIRINIAKENQ